MRELFPIRKLPSVVKLIEVSLFAAVLAARSNGPDVDVTRLSVFTASSPSSCSSAEIERRVPMLSSLGLMWIASESVETTCLLSDVFC